MYDQINSGFIFVAGIFYVLNLFKLIKDKDVKGISKLSICFFFCVEYMDSVFLLNGFRVLVDDSSLRYRGGIECGLYHSYD